MRTRYLLAIVLLVAGCGGGAADDDPPPGDAPLLPDGYLRLIGRTWNLQAGQLDIYRCVRFTVPQDMYITSIQALAPLGTHHTVLSIAGGMAGTGPDGEEDCTVFALGMQMLYASGVGTSPLDFPDGVGIKIAAGTQLHLNLHLYNASDLQMSGDSAVLVKATSTPPPTLAEMVFAGRQAFQIPARMPPQDETIEGGCTVDTPYTLFALWPHMHKIAKHQAVELIRGSETIELHDREFRFEDQTYYLQTPSIQVLPNDRINVKCTYFNNTGAAVSWGDESDDEMCYAGLYRYPAQGGSIFECTSF